MSFWIISFAVIVSLFLIIVSNNSNKKIAAVRNTYALGTIIQLKAFGIEGAEAINEAIEKLNDIDDKMSAFKSDSEISRINSVAGLQPQAVSSSTYFILNKATRYSSLTEGAFDPTVRPLVKLWNKGIEQNQIPDRNVVSEKLSLVNYKDIIFDENNRSVMLKNKGQEIDLGGIAKGYATDQVRDIFIKRNIKNGLIDLGGNIYALGSKPDGTGWKVGIQNPFKARGEYLGVLEVRSKSVVTSGNYEKYFVKDGKIFHHIIDPRTGFPSISRIISATIVSDDSLDGDGLSTGIYILGIQKSIELIESLKNIDAILVTDTKEVYVTSGICNCFRLTDNEFKIDRSCNENE